MRTLDRISIVYFRSVLLVSPAVFARPSAERPELSMPGVEIDAVGDVDGSQHAPQKALQDDFVWIAANGRSIAAPLAAIPAGPRSTIASRNPLSMKNSDD